ncbi:hypothetical protein [Streptomyces sp. NPDC049881]
MAGDEVEVVRDHHDLVADGPADVHHLGEGDIRRTETSRSTFRHVKRA